MLEHVRVAVGTGVVLGLWRGELAVAPTTAHLLTYYDGRCNANCKFCPQARESKASPSMLSRVVWPRCEFERVLEALRANGDKFERLCVQAVNYPGVVEDLCELTGRVREVCGLPISVSCQPLTRSDIEGLAEAGAERVSVALDAATPEVFERIKGKGVGSPYSWEGHLRALEEACSVFPGRVSTHLIVGLGESEEEMVRVTQFLYDRGITIGLFAFTPIPGTPLANHPRPDPASYHRIQLAGYLIANGLSGVERMGFDGGQISDLGVDWGVLNRTVESGEPFRTSGCPGCNRPFYNESPRGPIYNYPRKPTTKELGAIREQLGLEFL